MAGWRGMFGAIFKQQVVTSIQDGESTIRWLCAQFCLVKMSSKSLWDHCHCWEWVIGVAFFNPNIGPTMHEGRNCHCVWSKISMLTHPHFSPHTSGWLSQHFQLWENESVPPSRSWTHMFERLQNQPVLETQPVLQLYICGPGFGMLEDVPPTHWRGQRCTGEQTHSSTARVCPSSFSSRLHKGQRNEPGGVERWIIMPAAMSAPDLGDLIDLISISCWPLAGVDWPRLESALYNIYTVYIYIYVCIYIYILQHYLYIYIYIYTPTIHMHVRRHMRFHPWILDHIDPHSLALLFIFQLVCPTRLRWATSWHRLCETDGHRVAQRFLQLHLGPNKWRRPLGHPAPPLAPKARPRPSGTSCANLRSTRRPPAVAQWGRISVTNQRLSPRKGKGSRKQPVAFFRSAVANTSVYARLEWYIEIYRRKLLEKLVQNTIRPNIAVKIYIQSTLLWFIARTSRNCCSIIVGSRIPFTCATSNLEPWNHSTMTHTQSLWKASCP